MESALQDQCKGLSMSGRPVNDMNGMQNDCVPGVQTGQLVFRP